MRFSGEGLRLTGADLFVEEAPSGEPTGSAVTYLRGHRQLGLASEDWSIVDLSQNPGRRPRRSMRDGACPMLTRMCRLWSESHGQTLSGYARLAAHGLPVYPWAAAAAGVALGDFTSFNDTTRCAFAGNSMHVTCIGAAYLWVWASVTRQ